jgi:hypothetical protein
MYLKHPQRQEAIVPSIFSSALAVDSGQGGKGLGYGHSMICFVP